MQLLPKQHVWAGLSKVFNDKFLSLAAMQDDGSLNQDDSGQARQSQANAFLLYFSKVFELSYHSKTCQSQP